MLSFLILNLEAFNFRYNISFIDPPLGEFVEILPSVSIFPSGQSPPGNIITSGNISPNPPRSKSINDKYSPRLRLGEYSPIIVALRRIIVKCSICKYHNILKYDLRLLECFLFSNISPFHIGENIL